MKNTITVKGKRYVCRIYDSPPCGDRYTVCFKARSYLGMLYYPYIGMGETPFHPQGICQHGDSATMIDGKHLGKRISFEKLPLDCQKVILFELGELK